MSEVRHVNHAGRAGSARIAAILLGAALFWPAAALADDFAAPTRHLLTNGLDVTVFSSDNLLSRLDYVQDAPVIRLSDTRYLSVVTDVSDPSIYNKGDGEFHAFDEERVLSALSAISHPHLHMRVTVYLLPYPRRNVLVSSTSGTEIFLSPHVLDIPTEVSAYIVAHELGHALHNTYMRDTASAWNAYREVRGIEDTYKYSELATHPYRPKEIFAEDFRVLFGGPDAVWDGQIENPELVSPLVVSGLADFIRGVGAERDTARRPVIATSYPNPFNPETEIRVTVPDDVLADGDAVSVSIYDVAGALVREVYSSVPASPDVRVVWDGRDGRGNRVASAQYFARVQAGESTTTLKLVMLK